MIASLKMTTKTEKLNENVNNQNLVSLNQAKDKYVLFIITSLYIQSNIKEYNNILTLKKLQRRYYHLGPVSPVMDNAI